jgi:nucleoside-diphosphate-sugar epimerase/transcriptional regulator with XRE-family HTH domain
MGSALPGESRRSRRCRAPEQSRPREDSDAAVVLAEFAEREGLTHAQLADRLGVDRTYVSKVLSGSRQIRDVGRLRQFARTIGVPPERFGLLPDFREASLAVGQGHIMARGVRTDVEAWRKVRLTLNRRRPQLTKAAASLYDGATRIAGASLIALPGWVPSQPVDIGALELTWTDESVGAITGGEAESEDCRPLMPHGGRYPRYCHAIRDLDPPSLFENRVSYRLLDLVGNQSYQKQTYGYTTYFAMVDVCEAVAHEIAAVWLRRDGNAARFRLSELPFRALIGDPFDLLRRPVLPSTDTLTLRHDAGTGRSSLLLHRRNSDNVALAGGMTHIIPAGVFQPSGIAPGIVSADFDIWHNIVRELSEELLGNPEHSGSGEPIDYELEEKMRVLVTGATGFVGQALVRHLTAEGHSIIGFARTSRPCPCELRTGDILDQAAVEAAVDGVDAVCHLAALTLVRRSFAEPVRNFRVNLAGTLNLLDAMNAEAQRSGRQLRLVFASTGAVYGAPQTQPISETKQPAPSNPYGASKLAAEIAIGYQAALGGISAATLRAFNVAGAVDGQGDPDTSRIIPKTLMVAASQADCLNVNGDGSAVREYIHVRDLARAYGVALDAADLTGHRVYNVGSGVGVTVREVIEAAERVTGRPVPVRWGPPASEPSELRADISRIRAELGWQPSSSALETIVADAWQAVNGLAR